MARSVRWDLIADPSKWNRGFREAERTSGRFQRHVQRMDRDNVRFSASMGRLGPVAVRAFGGATVAAGGLAAAGAVLGLKTAANLETAQVGFTRLLGSARRAQSFLERLKVFAAKTPFELPGLVDASRSLLGAGVAAKNVIPILTALGDASGALGLDQERFGRVMLAVTQIMNRGKIQAEELNQITEAGIPVWSLLAKATGKPVPELQKLMQAGKLLAKDTLPALFDQMRKDYGGGMIAQSKTLAGIWSTVKDTISLAISDALQPLLPWLKTILPKAAEGFQRAMKGIVDFFRVDLAPELDRVKFAWSQNEDAIVGFVTSLTDTEQSMGTTKDAARSLADALERLVNVAGDAAEKGTATGNWLDRLSDQLTDSGGATDRLRDALRFVIPGLAGMSLEAGLANEKTKDLGTATDLAATAADRHAAALRGEKSALEALQTALDDEKTKELDLRQAKINVQIAQKRLNDLKAIGKTKSVDYRQAQINLERAQFQVKRQTDAYKDAQRRANAATSGAMTASQRATTPVRTLGLAAETGGRRAGAARVPWRKLGEDAAHAMAKIHSKRARITANFGWQGLEVFRIGPKGKTRLAFAGGGKVNEGTGPTADDVWARLSHGEFVVNARAARSIGYDRLERLNAMRFAQGGTVPQFSMQRADGFVRALNSWEDHVVKILNVGARALGNSLGSVGAGGAGPGALGRWIMQAIGITGVSPSWAGPLRRRAMFESGGNPRAINLWDSNAAAGHPSMGLMQTIGPTFNAYAYNGFRDVWNPVHNLIAAIRYIQSRYGTIFAIDPPVRGYDAGGMLPPGLSVAWNGTGRPEQVGGGTVELGRETIRALADELAKRIPSSVSVDAIHTGLRGKKNNTRIPLGLA